MGIMASTAATRRWISQWHRFRWTADAAGHANMLQLIHLRWLAVGGQLLTIAIVHFLMGISLPLVPMAWVIGALLVLNMVSLLVLRWRHSVANGELFIALMLDVAALSAQLYLSGGATNPFVSLFLLQVVLGSVLLDRWSAWVMVAATTLCFILLIAFHRPLALPTHYSGDLFGLHVEGMFICFALIAILLVLFVTRISGNLRARDQYLADMRQQAAEQDHIVRMGLLASGAAHELGTPLASLSVILGDWRRMPVIAGDDDLMQEIEEMQAALQRCKSIVTGILMVAGEARGEAPAVTTVSCFLDTVVDDWRCTRPSVPLTYANGFGDDLRIVSDTTLKQMIFNVLDNAAEASPAWVGMSVTRDDDVLAITITDEGPGFTTEMLANVGRPYHSTKGRIGGGLGLFLVVNAMRTLGGSATASNRPTGGAEVALRLPLSAIALTE